MGGMHDAILRHGRIPFVKKCIGPGDHGRKKPNKSNDVVHVTLLRSYHTPPRNSAYTYSVRKH